MKRTKASKKVVPFLQNAHYYFHKGNQYFQQNKLNKALIFFKKTIEVEPDNSIHHYNLACLLSRMGYLERANQVFSYIVNKLDPTLTECFFLMAVNLGLTDDLEKARYYLNLYLQCSPDGDMAVDAEELLLVLTEEAVEYRLQEEENLSDPLRQRACKPAEKDILDRYESSPSMQQTLWKNLYQPDSQCVENAIHIFGLMSENEAGKEALMEFVLNPWVGQRLRLQALLKLKNLGCKGVIPVYMDGCRRDVDLHYYPILASSWQDSWQEVIEIALKNMRSSTGYSEHFYEDLQAIWIDYLNSIYPRMPNIKKVETWSAGLEYALARYHFLQVTQKTLAQQYHVAVSSVSMRYREINRVLNIEHRAYHNMLRYLTQREND